MLVISHGVTLAYTLVNGKYNDEIPKETKFTQKQYFENVMIEPLFIDVKKGRKFYYSKNFDTYQGKKD